MKGRRGRLAPATIRKEIVTLRTAWNWGVKLGIVAVRYPCDGLRYPKSDEKPPFQTREESERQLPGLSPAQAAELWEALWGHPRTTSKFVGQPPPAVSTADSRGRLSHTGAETPKSFLDAS